jgi:hypothetical protein
MATAMAMTKASTELTARPQSGTKGSNAGTAA